MLYTHSAEPAMTIITGQRLFINRTDLHGVRFGADPDAPGSRPLQPGEARLEVQRFALTANNITYAAFGQAMKYWQFFPAADTAWGCLPVWGFAQLVESRADGVEPGQRVYGYLPAGTHLVVQPTRVSSKGFTDAAAHRQPLAAIYNQYSHCKSSVDADDAIQEGLRAVLQPLFMTAFLLDDFLAEHGFFGARQLLLSSASSKTAMATAYGLRQRRGTAGHPAVVGLTSASNLDFVQGLGCYDRTLAYGDVSQLDPHTPTVYVDFAGSAGVRAVVHTHFGDQLTFSSAIGGTHWADLGGSASLPGPRPSLFFAPSQAAQRSASPPAGWGRDVLEQRMAQAWQSFVSHVCAGPRPWVDISQQRGVQATEAGYRALLEGRAPANQGLTLSLL